MKRGQHKVKSQLCHNAVMTPTNHLTSLCSTFRSCKIRVPNKTISSVSLNLSYTFFICIQGIVLTKLQMNNSNFFLIFSQGLVEFFELCFLGLQGSFICLFVYCGLGLFLFIFCLPQGLMHVNKLSVTCLKLVGTFCRREQKLSTLSTLFQWISLQF